MKEILRKLITQTSHKRQTERPRAAARAWTLAATLGGLLDDSIYGSGTLRVVSNSICGGCFHACSPCRTDSMGGKNSVNNRCRIAKHFRPK
jgi:hypothetical protein